nr:immunoglobulin heavy chain junction region [Macaca mulatta]
CATEGRYTSGWSAMGYW